MTENAGGESMVDERLLRLASNPVRLDTLVLLHERPQTVAEIAKGLGISVSAAADHLEQMREAELVEPIDGPVAGEAAESRYRALVQVLWNDDEWAEFSREERRRLSAWVVQLINSDIDEALESGSFDARVDRHISRVASVVDEQGWRELARIQQEALEASFAVKAASAERLTERGEEGATVISAMFCFETPRRTRPS